MCWVLQDTKLINCNWCFLMCRFSLFDSNSFGWCARRQERDYSGVSHVYLCVKLLHVLKIRRLYKMKRGTYNSKYSLSLSLNLICQSSSCSNPVVMGGSLSMLRVSIGWYCKRRSTVCWPGKTSKNVLFLRSSWNKICFSFAWIWSLRLKILK